MYYTFGGFMAVEFGTGNEGGSGRAFSCAGGLGNRVVSTLPDFLPATTALQSPFVQVDAVLATPNVDQRPHAACRTCARVELPSHAGRFCIRTCILAADTRLPVCLPVTHAHLISVVLRHARRMTSLLPCVPHAEDVEGSGC